jgi:hypothetical protein
MHAIAYVIAGSKKQDRGRFQGSEVLQDTPAIHGRQHHVQHDHVVRILSCQDQAFRAVSRHIDEKAGLFQTLLDVGERLLLILNDQNPHVDASLQRFICLKE